MLEMVYLFSTLAIMCIDPPSTHETTAKMETRHNPTVPSESHHQSANEPLPLTSIDAVSANETMAKM